MIAVHTDWNSRPSSNFMHRDSHQRLLNLGCGSRYREGWTNVDITSSDPSIIAHDLRQRLPFDDQSFDLVYHSHVLEHFDRNAARVFLRECFRVLRPDGLIRVAVPDLEAIVRCYLSLLEQGLQGEPVVDDYDWILLELFDQTVRERSGGRMGDWLRRPDLPNRQFVLQRLGTEARRIMDAPAATQSASNGQKRSFAGRVAAQIQNRLSPARIRDKMIRRMLGSDYKALQIGRFRRRGEIHQWMYDQYSLARILRETGFNNPTVRTAHDSKISDWTSWQLDTEPDGSTYKPDSLFMEAKRPNL